MVLSSVTAIADIPSGRSSTLGSTTPASASGARPSVPSRPRARPSSLPLKAPPQSSRSPLLQQRLGTSRTTGRGGKALAWNQAIPGPAAGLATSLCALRIRVRDARAGFPGRAYRAGAPAPASASLRCRPTSWEIAEAARRKAECEAPSYAAH